MPRKVLRRKKRILNRKFTVKGFVNLLLVALIVGLGLLLAGSFVPKENFKMSKDVEGDVITLAPQSSNNNLELKPLAFTSPKTCQSEGKIEDNCSCPNQTWGNPDGPGLPPVHTNLPQEICGPNNDCKFAIACEACGWNSTVCPLPPGLVGDPIDPNQHAPTTIFCAPLKQRLDSGETFCFGKPVIYLYPEKPTLVDVKLSIPGDIYISIPHYPTNGWQNVLAKPDGSLIYEGKEFNELYYESKVDVKNIPRNGIIIPMSNLSAKLLEITGELGLKKSEQEEFLQYWLPKLNELKKNYIVFSLIDTSEKERIDGVDINPKPDVFINFLAYFKGIDYPIAIDPLTLPTPPARAGFTAVEWGGTIEPQ